MRSTLIAAAAALAVAACRHVQERPPEEQLVDRRQELRDSLDRAWRSYGGSEVAARPQEPGAGEPSTTGTVVGQMVAEADRSYFERQCLAAGRGERTVSVSPKLQDWLSKPENAKQCRGAAELQRKVDELERRVAGR